MQGFRKNTVTLYLAISAEGMDKHYLRFDEADLKKAMNDYTEWLDAKLSKIEGNEVLVNKWSTTA